MDKTQKTKVDLRAEKDKASKILTTQIKNVLSEKTEVEMDDDGIPVMVTKGEKLARLVVRMALGYKEEVERTYNEKKVIDTVVHGPHAGMIGLIYDRLEGKIPMAKEEEITSRKIADRVSDQGRNRINAAGKIKPPTGTKTT
jgi:hypothetical protein